MNFTLSVLLLLLVFNLKSSFAGVLETGSDLRDACGAIPPNLDFTDPMQGVKAMSCVGYISGVLDGWTLAGKPLCAPKSRSRSEAARIVDRYIDEHPEELHLAPAPLVIRAMDHAWPCR
jgi:hypothetical protein